MEELITVDDVKWIFACIYIAAWYYQIAQVNQERIKIC